MSQTRVKPDPESPPDTPRWVKVFGVIALVAILIFIILMFTPLFGDHGPRRHRGGGDIPSYIVTGDTLSTSSREFLPQSALWP